MSKEENDMITQLKKAIRNAESQHAYYRKRYNATDAPPSVTPYLKLATIYRKQKNYQGEVEVLERFVKIITTEDGQVHAFQQSTRDMLTRLERARQLIDPCLAIDPYFFLLKRIFLTVHTLFT